LNLAFSPTSPTGGAGSGGPGLFPAWLSDRCPASAIPGGHHPNPGYPMNKQFLISVVVVFIASMLLDFCVHAVLLKDDYAAEPALMRKEADAQRHFPAMLAAHVLIALGVTAIYRRGRESGKGWLGQGVRFGFWFAVASGVPGFLIYYAVQPMGLILAVKQIIFGGTATLLLGLVVAGLNK
jgi:hypothetical protein